MLKKQIIPIVRAFQSALPRGERQQIGGSPDEDRNISIHAPARGATIQLHLTQCCSVFQSTLPRGERHHAGFAAFYVGISIHAPTRGATISKRVSSPSLRISIHAPTRGATTGSKVCRKVFVISIHAPTRGATTDTSKYVMDFTISIHAPTRGATQCGSDSRQRYRYFNPRSHEGSDALFYDAGCSLIRFQSTLPRGERPFAESRSFCSLSISIHAPTRGATLH